VLYNMFEWPTLPGARLAVIGISNTHDLDSRVLPRIASRLGACRLAFNPYSVAQLTSILNARLAGASGPGGASVVGRRAVEFAARKVAGETGDSRRALQLLSRAVELAEGEARGTGGEDGEEPPPPPPPSQAPGGPAGEVGPHHVSRAINEMFETVHAQLMGAASRLEKLLLVAAVVEGRASGRADVSLQAVAARVAGTLCPWTRDERPPLGAVLAAATRLGAQRLLITDPRGLHLKARIMLNVDKSDVAHAIGRDPDLAELTRLL